MQVLMGIDIGTSAVKVIGADPQGTVLASHSEGYPLYTPRPGWAEQDPSDWWRAVCVCSRAVVSALPAATEIAGVSFSGQMHGLVALDASRQVIRPAILWCDQRTEAQCAAFTAACGGPEGLLALTNNAMLTGYTGGKLLWLREEEPASFERMRLFLCPKDYIRLLLCGEPGMDVSEASGTGLFDTRARRWSEEAIRVSGLPWEIFPETAESTALAGRVTREAAALTGIPAGTPVYYGGGDAVIQTTGAGLIRPGVLGVVIGTAGNVSMGLDRFTPNPGGKLQMFCNNEPGLWHAFGCTLSAGGAYRWYRDALNETASYEDMNAQAAASRPGANGVLFAPYLSGERCPYPDPNARGVFYGLTLGTARADVTRAVMEGVTYSLRQVAGLMMELSSCQCVYISGGGAVSPLWRQITADVFRMPVYTMSAADVGGAYGAMMAAGVGCGVWKSLAEAAGVLRRETETLPDPAAWPAYEEAYGMYCRLYGALRETFAAGAVH